MLVLFETAAGHALFKVKDESKLSKVESILKHFESTEKANKLLQLKGFHAFKDTTQAVSAATDLVDAKLGKDLKKFLRKNTDGMKEKLAVSDKALGSIIKEKLGIPCVHDPCVFELMRGIRTHMNTLISGLEDDTLKSMTLGLSHTLSRYKLKFSADKVDTMIVQAIGLLDELDKEINTYSMRAREWFGWHFPEMGKIVTDNVQYVKTAQRMGIRNNVATLDFSDILAEDVETTLRDTCQVSMGTDISEEDVLHIRALCNQVLSLSEYRTQLFEYLKNRMNAIAPNLSIMVGELVGARLIAHAGSLMNLAKHPASTVQILGAEKALFRALKTKHDTPKYGLIYHASLIGQTAPSLKGKISRVLAAKTSLAVRVDALGDATEATIGFDNRAKVEARVRQLENGVLHSLSGKGKLKKDFAGYKKPEDVSSYNVANDFTLKKVKEEVKKEKVSVVEEKVVVVEETIKEETKDKKKKKKKRKSEETDGKSKKQKKSKKE